MPTDNRATAERIALEVYDKWCDEAPELRSSLRLKLVLAGMAHRDRTAEREAAWEASGAEYDRSIHHNGDAREWARFFLRTFPNCGADEATMHGWFANAMMAMYDGPCAKKLKDAEREAASKAWDAAREWMHHRPPMGVLDWNEARDRYLAAEFDAGERVTLSDGSVVTWDASRKLWKWTEADGDESWTSEWRMIPNTGADFDAVKRLAERGAER